MSKLIEAELFTREEAAEWLKVSERTVRRLIQSGKLRYLCVGSQVRIPAAALEEFAQGCVVSSPNAESKQPNSASTEALKLLREYGFTG